MKILHITRQFYPAIGGIETMVLELCRALLGMGHDVHIVTLDRLWGHKEKLKSEETLEGIFIHRIPFIGNRRYAIAPKVLEYIYLADLVHLHSSDFFLDFLALTKVWHKKPLILSSHGFFFHTAFLQQLKRIYFHSVTRSAVKNVDGIICNSNQDEQVIRQITTPAKIHIIPNGISVPDNLPLSKDSNLILSVGRLFVNKRFDRLITVFAKVSQNLSQLKLVIIGEDQGEGAKLIGLIHSLGLQEKVLLLGKVDETQKWDWLSRARFWALASEYESFGISVVEAMAAGCIPFVSKLPAFDQFITPSRNGYYVEFERSQQAAKIITETVQKPNTELDDLSHQAKQKASEFQWSTIAYRFERVYKDILGLEP